MTEREQVREKIAKSIEIDEEDCRCRLENDKCPNHLNCFLCAADNILSLKWPDGSQMIAVIYPHKKRPDLVIGED